MLSAKADVIEEFAKSFSSSWFAVKGLVPGALAPAHISKDRAAAGGHLPITFISGPSGLTLSHDLRWDTGRDQIIRDFPTLGAVKAGPTVCYMDVKPRRQFKKGYVPENVDFYVPNEASIKRHFPRIHIGKTSKRLIWHIFNRMYWGPHDAASLIADGEEIGCPLSNKFSLYVDESWDAPVLMREKQIVGVCREGNFLLLPEYEIFKEEFKRATKEQIEVCRSP